MIISGVSPLNTPNNSINFGANNIIPKRKLVNSCNEMLDTIDKKRKISTLAKLAKKYKKSILAPILENPYYKLTKKELNFFKVFRHEVKNLVGSSLALIEESSTYGQSVAKKFRPEIVTDKQFFNFQKQEFKKIINTVKSAASEWKQAEKIERNSDIAVDSDFLFSRLTNIAERMNAPSFDISGQEVLKGRFVHYPNLVHSIISQPLLNAIKYGEGKPFQIVIEEIEDYNPKRFYTAKQSHFYASFINPETKPLADADIDKILLGNKHRTEDAKKMGITGSGEGFPFIIDTMRKFGYEDDISKLIEKGRKKGVCVRIPLIGIQ